MRSTDFFLEVADPNWPISGDPWTTTAKLDEGLLEALRQAPVDGASDVSATAGLLDLVQEELDGDHWLRIQPGDLEGVTASEHLERQIQLGPAGLRATGSVHIYMCCLVGHRPGVVRQSGGLGSGRRSSGVRRGDGPTPARFP